MKHNYLILTAIAFMLALTLFGCKKHEEETLTPQITNEKVEVTATAATFTWTVDWPGKLISVVEVSENEDMSHSQIYGLETETENHNFSVTITDLKAVTKYYYRFWVWNQFYTNDKYKMEVKDFLTKADLPKVKTVDVTDVSRTTATVIGEVLDDCGVEVTERGVCWSTSSNPTINGSHLSEGSGVGVYSITISNLIVGMRYYVRAYAVNSKGTAYGDEMDFVTGSAEKPTIITSEITNIDWRTATGGGEITDNGGALVTQCGICWSTSHNPEVGGNHIDNDTGTGSFVIDMSGLTAGTTYYVRSYAKNIAGLSYGNEVSFETKAPERPVVTTDSVTDITYATAKGRGSVTSDCGNEVTERGICWSTDPAPEITDSHVGNGTGMGDFTVEMIELVAKTTYYVRAYAKNSIGLSYGDEVRFTTEAQPFTISVSANPVDGGTVTGEGDYPQGQSVTVKATPKTGYEFVKWKENDSVVSSNANYTFVVNGNRTLVANFVKKTFTIDVLANPSNGGELSGGGTYEYGQSCTVKATAANGFRFDRWTENGSVVSQNTSYTFTVSSNRTLTANFTAIPVGIIDGLFTVNSSGDKVYFSQGNLQYIGSASTPYWKFAEHQWDYLGTATGQNSTNHYVDRDLFGWGTSRYHNGYDSNNVNYQPYSTSKEVVNTQCNTYGYGPSTNMSEPNLTGSSAEYDWGVHNAISNGGNQTGLWRTLTADEWIYVIQRRSASTVGGTANARFVMATVNGKTGVVLFPDIYSHPSYLPSPLQVNNANGNASSNSFSGDGWSAMENLGCVFLPAAGGRGGTSVDNVGQCGDYWTSSYRNASEAYSIDFTISHINYQNYLENRYCGLSVRLVRNAQ